MKKINLIGKYAILLFAFVFIGSVVSASAQTKKQQELEKRFTDFEVKVEGFADIGKDSDGKEFLKNCKIKVHIKNISGSAVKDWIFEAKASRHTGLKYEDGRFEDIKKPGNYLSNNSSTEIVFDTYCYMLKDSLKVYKSR